MNTGSLFSRFLILVLGVTSAACSATADEPEKIEGNAPVRGATPTEESEQGSHFEGVPSEVLTSLSDTQTTLAASALDKIYRLEHKVWVGPNKQIAVTETFTLRSWLRLPHRAMFMVPPQGSNRQVYNIPVDGYDGGAIMARQGYFSFSVDPPGTGGSYAPADGLTVTYESEAAVLTKVADQLRVLRLVPKLDAFGEEIGGGVVAHLCADAKRFSSCVMPSMIYKTGSEFFYSIAPFFEALILSSPDGYFTSTPESYFNVLSGASPAVSSYYLSTQIGRYAAGPYKQDFDRLLRNGPSYDPRNAAVRGLIIRGENDNLSPLADAQQLTADYGSLGGGRAELKVIPNGTHIVRLDASPAGPTVWELTKQFVDRPE